ncbi:MarR family winged helix-turn-helix transcriptional regulator [Streptococcus sanguinis]|uniref:MarR family transcriptional regulator n=1 Tax=Streptococcus sanguinis TaxID=1305 RepID=A0A2X3V4C7_STRSA|nr:MarR family transcriptional regulator [Streptococcus sanguinis]EGJ42625.1 MarR family transcriptional regulator [Streptococcus sanguinis SK1059]EGQ18807.1 MarR family transcriptional regulator [Streptococcus sanguinis ATCC 29667]EGQ25252.1 MarR family transcriptional regulator [Streptococcus sanguinis SK340]SQF36160.1 MarR family transcriptional regulator [Streptococcus sanguinis]
MEKSQFNSIYKDEYKKSTGLLFIRTYHKWHGMIKNKLRTIDLTHPQFVVLTTLAALLRQQEWVSQTDIAQFSDMDVMTVSQIIRLLVKKELIMREVHPKDSRANIILLTDTGLQKVNQALPLVEGIDQAFFGKLENNTETLNQLLIELEAEND